MLVSDLYKALLFFFFHICFSLSLFLNGARCRLWRILEYAMKQRPHIRAFWTFYIRHEELELVFLIQSPPTPRPDPSLCFYVFIYKMTPPPHPLPYWSLKQKTGSFKLHDFLILLNHNVLILESCICNNLPLLFWTNVGSVTYSWWAGGSV